jgi:hypothetical protein
VEAGQSCRAVAKLFGVSVSSVVKWRQRTRATGSAAVKPMGGKRPVLLAGKRAFILDRIALKPHTSIRALQAELAEHGATASHGAVTLSGSCLSRRHGQDEHGADARVVPARQACHWQGPARALAHHDLRCRTAIDRIDAPYVFDCPINGESFLAHVEQAVPPTLRTGDIVVIDNLGSHSAVIRARPLAGPFAPPVPSSCSCRPTRPISIRSSRCCPSSRCPPPGASAYHRGGLQRGRQHPAVLLIR